VFLLRELENSEHFLTSSPIFSSFVYLKLSGFIDLLLLVDDNINRQRFLIGSANPTTS